MPLAQPNQGLIEALAHQPPDAQVRVIVRPSSQVAAGKPLPVDPKRFPSAREYRQALIDRQKAESLPAKTAVLELARRLGLEAHAAGALNAVVIKGTPARVLALIEGADLEFASLERHLEF